MRSSIKEMEIDHTFQKKLEMIEWRLMKAERAMGITLNSPEVIKNKNLPCVASKEVPHEHERI